jgi:hypothetical protein
METEVDRRVLRLMVDGERRTAVFAAVLGLDGQPAEAQRREVKRAKDRIKKRLERAGWGRLGRRASRRGRLRAHEEWGHGQTA